MHGRVRAHIVQMYGPNGTTGGRGDTLLIMYSFIQSIFFLAFSYKVTKFGTKGYF